MAKKHPKAKWEPFRKASLVPVTEAKIQGYVEHGLKHNNPKNYSRKEYEKHVRTAIALEDKGVVYLNNLYQVNIHRVPATASPEMFHLSIKRLNRQPVHDWRHLQRIKNELLGPEYEAVELYPAESRLVDTANQYHLWAFCDPDRQFPFGMDTGRYVSEFVGDTGASQRRFSDG